jgi:hypothetical protein
MRLPVSSSLDGMPAASRGASLGDITSGQQSLPGSPTGIEETRETMRKFLLIFAFFFVVLPIRATDLYIAQTATGGNTGADCSDAHPYTFFNNSSNWPSPIGPGTTVHICGTITAPAGAGAFLTFQGSGVSGNPITLKFENGAVLAAPYFAGTGAINTNGKNYITIDGNNLQGTIENTLSGTSGATCLAGPCAYQPVYSFGVNCTSGSSNLTIQNLNIIDIYIHASLSDEGGQATYGINCTNGNAISIIGNVTHDMKWGISAGLNGGTWAGIDIGNNTIYNVDHGIYYQNGGTQPGPVNIFGNDVQTGTTWDDDANGNHHDHIHISGNVGASSMNGVTVYNNYLHGDPGANGNAYFYSFPGSPSPIAPIYYFNNLVVNTSTKHFTAGGMMWCFTPVCYSYNNTFVAVANGHSSAGPDAAQMGGVGSIHENNIVSGTSVGVSFLNPGTETSDYNDYWQCCGSSPAISSLGYNAGTFFTSLASWKSATGYDSHSSQGNPDLSASYQPTNGSAAIGLGTNLTTICSGQPNPGLGALCSDRAGNPRPVTGAWDAGAYQSGGATGDQPTPPTGLIATVQQ